MSEFFGCEGREVVPLVSKARDGVWEEEEEGLLPSNEVSSSGGSMETWIQPVGVTLVERLEDIRSDSVVCSAAIWNCFS